MRHLLSVLVGLAILGLCYASSHAQEKDKGKGKDKEKKKEALVEFCPGPSYKHLDGRRIVIAINNWKGWNNCSEGLQETNSDWNLGLIIVPINWSRYDQRFQDLRDNDAQLNAALKVSTLIAAIRKDAPGAQIFVVGHGCGARVALAAAEMSGPRSIDRIILQHAAVANCYDLRGALKATRYGIDNLYSDMDAILEATAAHAGNADGMPGIPAGISGFKISCDPKDAEAYRGLRQLRWTLDYYGNGGHCAWTMHHNVKRTIVPMLDCTPQGELVVVPPPTKIERKEKEKGKMPVAD